LAAGLREGRSYHLTKRDRKKKVLVGKKGKKRTQKRKRGKYKILRLNRKKTYNENPRKGIFSRRGRGKRKRRSARPAIPGER